MVTHTQWIELDTYKTLKFIEDVRDDDFAALFAGTSYELHARKLGFLGGYSHYQLCNKAMIPYFKLDYISNGSEHYYLDGSEHPLELLVQLGALRLTEGNVLDYLEFHSDVAFYPYRKVKFIMDPSKTPYSGASAMGHHFNTLKYHSKFEMTYSDTDTCYYITVPVLYNGETVKGHVQVMESGEINILKPVNIPLMDRMREHKALHYSHPHADEILAENIRILRQSETAKNLLEDAEKHNSTIKIISGVGSSMFATHSSTAFVVAPQNIETESPYQILGIAGALKQLSLMNDGYFRSGETEEEEEIATTNFAHNLEILLAMCIIIEELDIAGYDLAVQKFRESGYESLYSSYKNGGDWDAHVAVYRSITSEDSEED
jgi:hypothetical protein